MEWTASIFEFRDKGRLDEFERGELFEMNDLEIRDLQTLEQFDVDLKSPLFAGHIFGDSDDARLQKRGEGIEVALCLGGPRQ